MMRRMQTPAQRERAPSQPPFRPHKRFLRAAASEALPFLLPAQRRGSETGSLSTRNRRGETAAAKTEGRTAASDTEAAAPERKTAKAAHTARRALKRRPSAADECGSRSTPPQAHTRSSSSAHCPAGKARSRSSCDADHHDRHIVRSAPCLRKPQESLAVLHRSNHRTKRLLHALRKRVLHAVRTKHDTIVFL